MPDLGTLNYTVIMDDIVHLADLLLFAAQVMGFGLLGLGLLRLIVGAGRSVDAENMLFGGVGLTILCGACLVSITTFIDIAGVSIGGVQQGLSSVGVTEGIVTKGLKDVGPEQFSAAVRVAFGVAWVVGLLGIISGLNTLRIVNQNSQTGFAITKILGGAAAMNLSIIIKAMSSWGGIFSQLANIVK